MSSACRACAFARLAAAAAAAALDPLPPAASPLTQGAAMQQAQEAQPPASWDDWLANSVAQLRQRSLFRTLRPTVPGLSAVEVRAPGHPCKHVQLLPLPCCQILSRAAPLQHRSLPPSPSCASTGGHVTC